MATTTENSTSTVKKTTNEVVDWNQITEFNHIFEIMDDEGDKLEYTNDMLNEYFQSGHLNEFKNYDEYICEDEFLNCYLNKNETTQTDEIILSQTLRDSLTTTEQEGEQEVRTLLMPKKRQQSNSELHTSISIKKKVKTTTDDSTEIDPKIMFETRSMPSYMLTTNKLFSQMAKTAMESSKSISINDVQNIAMLFYRKGALQIDREITKAYFHSVQGTLKESEVEATQTNRSVWPPPVQSFMLAKIKEMKAKDDSTSVNATTSITSLDINDDRQRFICSDLLTERIQEMKEQIHVYENELHDKKNSLVDFTSQTENIIRNYVEEYCIKPLEMKRKLKMALLTYDFDTEILKRQYLHEKPNQYQIQIAQKLYDAKRESERSRRTLLELKQQVFYNKALYLFNSFQTSMLTTSNQVDPNISSQSEKVIQQKKLDHTIAKIIETERKFHQHQQVFDEHMSTMWKYHRNLVKDYEMPTVLINIIEKTLNKIVDRWRAISNYRIDYYLRNSYDEQCTSMNDNDVHTKQFGFSSFVIMDTNYKFISKQMQLLNRGPTYVPPCQLSVSTSFQAVDDIIKKQYAPLKHQLTNLFSNYHINIALSMELNKKIFEEYKQNFSVPIPTICQQRAVYERKLIQSIRYSLNKNQLILRRTADNRNTFYVGNCSDFETKVNDYLSQSDSYKLLANIDDNQQWHKEFKEMINSINYLLEQLKQHKAIQNDIYNRLVIDINKVRLPYMYFLPDISKENSISLVPSIVTQQSATVKIGKFLHQLLRPFVDKILASTTFRDDVDFIRKLNNFIEKDHHLQAKAIFCTIEIINFSTLDIHTNMIDIVGYFLNDNLVSNKLQQITIQTIKNLLYIYLNNNIVSYNGPR